MSTSGTDQRSNFLNARECCLHLAQYHCSVSPSCSRSASFRKQSSTSMDAAPRPPSSSRRRADAWSSTASRSAASTRPARSSSDHSKVTVCTVDGSASASAPRSLSKRVPDAVDAQRQAEQLVLLRRARARRARRAERGPRAPRRRDLAEEHVHRAALGLAVGAPAVQLEGNQFIVGLDVLHGERVRERPVDAVAPDVAQIQIAAAPRVRAVGQRHERVLQRAHGLARGHGDDQLQRPRAQGQLEQRHGDAARLRRRQRQRQAQVGVEGDGLVVAVRAGDVALELAVARVDDDALVAHLEPAPRLARHLGVGPAVRLERLRVGLALDAVQVLVEAV
mmetsp:Transcript_8603/g.29453  ORF Transcript_8603/g.29453 Transcript_8603/m.29453 type:complete len:336 (-) Transcript_8603:331-1338(-)